MNGRLTRSVIAGLCVVTLFPGPASATRLFEDPDDQSGALDVAAFWHGTGDSDAAPMVHGVRMFEPWTTEDLSNGGSWIAIWFNPARDDQSFKRKLAFIRNVSGELRATMHLQGVDSPAENLGRIRVRRTGPYGLEIRFPKTMLRKKRLTAYKWHVQTSWEAESSTECPVSDSRPFYFGSCQDFAPGFNQEIVRHL